MQVLCIHKYYSDGGILSIGFLYAQGKMVILELLVHQVPRAPGTDGSSGPQGQPGPTGQQGVSGKAIAT